MFVPQQDSLESGADEHEGTSKAPISFFAAWCIPGVAVYSVCYALVKGVNYGLFFWLPVYLHNAFDMSNTDAGFYSVRAAFPHILPHMVLVL